jgi:hypothetical protein
MSGAGRARGAIGALLAIGALGIAGTALGAANGMTKIRAGDVVITAGGVISPKALPRHELAPIVADLHGSIATTDGSHVPPAKSVQLDIDRHFHVDTSGLATCKAARLEADTPAQALRNCSAALVGRGKASAEVQFSESSPFSATGRLLAFNGPPSGSAPQQFDYLYVDVPVPTAVVVRAKLARGSGPYGYRVSVMVPKIAGGAGSVTAFRFKLDRKWTHGGRRHSYLSAECPNGRFSDRVEALFEGGIKLNGTLVNSCQPKG